jgi:hypothetical protein
MGGKMLERDYQAQLIRRLRRMFPGCVILKNDSDYMQGVPDLTILWQDKWAMLEVKTSKAVRSQPNQRYYIDELNRMSFASFIYPSIEEDVLDALQQAFRARRITRIPERVKVPLD